MNKCIGLNIKSYSNFNSQFFWSRFFIYLQIILVLIRFATAKVIRTSYADRNKKMLLFHTCTISYRYKFFDIGEMAEWSKAHAWKVCKRQKRFMGSNPILSAIDIFFFRYQFFKIAI